MWRVVRARSHHRHVSLALNHSEAPSWRSSSHRWRDDEGHLAGRYAMLSCAQWETHRCTTQFRGDFASHSDVGVAVVGIVFMRFRSACGGSSRVPRLACVLSLRQHGAA
jgi:hypothetical protein